VDEVGINTRLIESTGRRKKGSVVSESEMKRETGQRLPERKREKEHHAVGCEREV
jgi:hypothetical protein